MIDSMFLFLWIIIALIAILAGLDFVKRERVAMDDATRAHAPGSFAILTHGKTHYVLEGPENGELIVLVPGATLPLWIWKDLPARLTQAGYRVLRYDLYGRGYSDRPHVTYDLPLFEQQLFELLQSLNLTKPSNLIGLAFGSLIACQFAVNHSSLVKRICLLTSDGFGVHMSPLTRLMQLPIMGDYLFRVVGTKGLLARLPEYSRNSQIVDWLQQHYIQELRIKGFKRSILSSLRHVALHNANQLFQKLNEKAIDVCIIWGTQDPVTPLPDQQRLQQAFPGAQVHALEQVGHLPHVERPEIVEAILKKFFTAR